MLLLLLLAGGCARQPVAARGPLDAFTGHLDQRIPRLLDQYGVPGASIALVRQGKVVWSGAYGYADSGRQQPMTVDAVCRAESISKSVTAWGVMRLVDQGLVDLDEPVQQYLGAWTLPASEYSLDEVTVRRLLSGNSGMSLGTIGEEYAPQSDMPSMRDYLTREAHLMREPGTGFSYSNTGFNILELLVEEVTGREFTAYMADEVLAPLAMRQASFTWDEAFSPQIPTGYELQGVPVPPYVYPVHASGGLFATADDIARFISAGMTDFSPAAHGVMGDEQIGALYAPAVEIPGIFGFVADSYGFGHFVETLADGRQAVWHGGQGHGWMTHFHAVPESGDGIVLLTNSQRSWPFMAQVLRDWAQWSGIGSVKFVRILYATGAMWALIGLVALLSLWYGYRLARELRSGRRRWAPLSGESLAGRLLRAALGLAVIVALAWSAAQPYLMISSVFPSAAGWLGVSLLILALLVIMFALCPRRAAASR